jgi:hypothetical protein
MSRDIDALKTEIARLREALATARAEALEEAAGVAEAAGETWSGSRCAETAAQEAAVDAKCVEIASAIRKLKEARS